LFPQHGSCYSGSLRRNGGYDQGRQASDRINHLKAAVAAGIEMGILFLCKVDAFTYESMDAQEMNVTFCDGKIITSNLFAKFVGFLHYLPPVSRAASIYRKGATKLSVFIHGAKNQTFGLQEGSEVPPVIREPF
jgi:hypothetical protein